MLGGHARATAEGACLQAVSGTRTPCSGGPGSQGCAQAHVSGRRDGEWTDEPGGRGELELILRHDSISGNAMTRVGA